jgi:hypothetical protein
MGSVVDMVLFKVDAVDLRFHMAARDAAALETGSTNELCLEICSAYVPIEPAGGRAMEISGRWVAAMGGLLGDSDCCLRGDGQDGDAK